MASHEEIIRLEAGIVAARAGLSRAIHAYCEAPDGSPGERERWGAIQEARRRVDDAQDALFRAENPPPLAHRRTT